MWTTLRSELVFFLAFARNRRVNKTMESASF
jgi:hypothetical protein